MSHISMLTNGIVIVIMQLLNPGNHYVDGLPRLSKALRHIAND